MSSTFYILAIAVFVAFAVESALGFGATLLSVAIGSLAFVAGEFELYDLLAVVVPLNLLLSGYLVYRNRDKVKWRYLFRSLIGWMLVGFPLGMALATTAPLSLLKRLFGVFLVGIAARELYREAIPLEGVATERPKWLRRGLTILAGVVHGLFTTSGPLVAFVASTSFTDKSTYRATLSALWLMLGCGIATFYAVRGDLTPTSLRTSGLLVPVVVAAVALGEWLHHKVPESLFRRSVFSVLILAGVMFVIRG